MGSDYNTDQKKKQVRIDKDSKYVKARNVADIQKLLRIPEFRRFIWRLLSDAGLFRSSFTQNAMTMSFSEGQRDIGLAALDDLNEADINAFAQIQSEYISEQKSKEALEQKETEKDNARP